MTVVAGAVLPIEGEEGTLPGGAGRRILVTGRSRRIGYGKRGVGRQASPVPGMGREGLWVNLRCPVLFRSRDAHNLRIPQGFRSHLWPAVIQPVPSHGSTQALSLSKGREFHRKPENRAAENEKRQEQGLIRFSRTSMPLGSGSGPHRTG